MPMAHMTHVVFLTELNNLFLMASQKISQLSNACNAFMFQMNPYYISLNIDL